MTEDWPIIQCRATPSDAELEAERDAKHLKEVAEWFAGGRSSAYQWSHIDEMRYSPALFDATTGQHWEPER